MPASEPHYEDDTVTLWNADCLDVLAEMPDNSIDAIVCDPPYGLANTTPTQVAETITAWISGDRTYIPQGRGFMGRSWDAFVPPVAVWDECLRVLKPGGHALVFVGSRTQDLMGLGLRLAGFEMRDSIAWLYGSGFPKSLDVSKAVDKANGRVGDAVLTLKSQLREVFDASGLKRSDIDARCGFRASNYLTLPAEGKRPDPWVNVLPTAEKWVTMRDVLGCGTDLDGLFDAAEREVIGARTTGIGTGRGAVSYIADSDNRDITAPATRAAQQWAGWGSALKPAHEPIVVARKPLIGTIAQNVLVHGTGALNVDGCRVGTGEGIASAGGTRRSGGIMGESAPLGGWEPTPGQGRWPTNVVLDGDMAKLLDQSTGDSVSRFFPVMSDQCGDESTGDANTFAGKKTASSDDSSHTVGSGSKPTGPFPKGTRSTTGTTTHSITTCPTSCASQPSGTTTTTSDCASSTCGLTASSTDGARSAPSGAPSTTTTSAALGPGRATASHVSEQRAASGLHATATSSTPAAVSGVPLDSVADLLPWKYQAKAPTRERPSYVKDDGTKIAHPTTKPLTLMKFLVRLVTPPGGTVLDPFAGSGTTIEACLQEGFQAIGIEREADYLPLIEARIARNQTTVEGLPAAVDALALFDVEEPA